MSVPDAAKAQVEWSKMTPAEKKKVDHKTMKLAIDVLQTEAMPLMKDAGLKFDKDPLFGSAVLAHGARHEVVYDNGTVGREPGLMLSSSDIEAWKVDIEILEIGLDVSEHEIEV